MEFKEFINERKRMCKAHSDGVMCCCVRMKCPLNELKERSPENSCYAGCVRYSDEAEKVVEKWSKENPPLTNLDKYKQAMKELFGAEVENGPYGMYLVIKGVTDASWWNEPYKEPEK